MSYIGNAPITAAFLVDTFSGTGSQTAFTMTVAPANTSSIIVAVTGVLQDPSTYSVSGTTLTFSAAPPSGTSNISVRYLGIPASGVTTTAYRTVTNTTATAGQTSFTIPSYTVGYVDVYRNGVYLPTSDYTASTGTTVVLNNAATAGDTITTVSFYVSSVLNAIANTAGSVSASNLAASGTGSSSNFLRGDMAWTSATGTGSVALASLPTFTTTIGVGGTTASASGAGISFPATQSASSDANTLDDYEEGTYTPTITFNTTNGNLTYSVQIGRYIKIGQLVYVGGQIVFAQTTASSYFYLNNLPFTSKNITNFSPSTGCGVDGMNGLSGGIYIQISANSVAAYPYQSQTGVSNIIVSARCNGGSATITWGFTYLSDV